MKKNLFEKTVSSEKVYDGRFLKVQRDQVILPDGKTSQREYILHPGAAVIIPVLDNGHIVMVKQYRHALRQIFLELPAGKVDHGEKTLETAQRELQEETGYVAKDWRYLTTIHPVIGYADEKMDIFLAKNLSHVGAQLDEGEFLELIEIAPDELLAMVRRGEVTDVKTQIGIFWLEKVISSGW